MFRRIFLAALVAGGIAGLFASLAQEWRVIPLIQQAEVIERGGSPASHDHGDHGHGTEAEGAQAAPSDPWAPADGLERKAFTAFSNMLTGIAFALLLTAAFALSKREVDFQRGVIWGIAGFAALTAAPSLGLPPELPGTIAADLYDRQIWWASTAAATAAGLALMVFAHPVWTKILAVALIVAPHVVGAPAAPEAESAIPAELAAQFAIASVVTSGLFWLVLGGLAGLFYKRLGRD